jgi:uncharacterized protein YndB with AHSA1/START domain
MNAAPHPVARARRSFAATPDRVFDACLQPAMIGKWMFGPALRDEQVVNIALDRRVGGSFSFVVRRQGQDIDHVGEYLEIDPPRRLAFTWSTRQDAARSRVTIDIVAQDGGCALTLAHELDPNWADHAGRIEASWAKMLDALAAHIERTGAPVGAAGP